MNRSGNTRRSANRASWPPLDARSIELVFLQQRIWTRCKAPLPIPREDLADVFAGGKSIVDRPEVEAREIDRVVPQGVDPPDRVLQRQPGPWAFTELVGVVVNEPVGVELGRQLGLSLKNPLPGERPGTRPRGIVAEALDGDHAFADMGFDGLHRAIGRSIVEKINRTPCSIRSRTTGSMTSASLYAATIAITEKSLGMA